VTPPVNLREVIERALDKGTVDAARDAADIFRRLKSGQEWSSPTLAVVRDRFARAKRDIAVARALLAELDAVDVLAELDAVDGQSKRPAGAV
jgi:hypothetical protein